MVRDGPAAGALMVEANGLVGERVGGEAQLYGRLGWRGTRTKSAIDDTAYVTVPPDLTDRRRVRAVGRNIMWHGRLPGAEGIVLPAAFGPVRFAGDGRSYADPLLRPHAVTPVCDQSPEGGELGRQGPDELLAGIEGSCPGDIDH